MNADQIREARVNNTTAGLKHVQLTEKIIGVFYAVYNELGQGFLESVCESCTKVALEEAGFRVERQVPIQCIFGASRSACFLPI